MLYNIMSSALDNLHQHQQQNQQCKQPSEARVAGDNDRIARGSRCEEKNVQPDATTSCTTQPQNSTSEKSGPSPPKGNNRLITLSILVSLLFTVAASVLIQYYHADVDRIIALSSNNKIFRKSRQRKVATHATLAVSRQQRRKSLYHRQKLRLAEEDEDEDGDDEDRDQEDEDDEENEDKDDEEEEEEEDNKDDEDEDDKDDEQDSQDDEEDDDEQDNQDDDDQQQQQQPDGDDFFGEDLADDYIKDNNIDDFYAFVDSPEPPHLFPLSEREIVGYCIASAALTLGASGGIGGGGIVVPVYLLVMGMGPKMAIPIGAVTVLGGALSSTMINWQRRHPLADRPVIDWDFVLVMQPVVLIGVLFGTFIHQLLSEQILIVLLVVLLSVTAHSTLSKAMRMFEAEKRYIRHYKASQIEAHQGSPSRTFTWGDGELHTMKPQQAAVDVEEKQRILIENPDFVTLRSDLLEEEKFTPNSKIMILVCVISVLITLNVMVGGGGIDSPWGITCGSLAFWTIHAVMICFLMLAAWAAQTYLIARHEIKNIIQFDYVHGDIRWNRRAGWALPVVFMVAGLLAGMFGIGGGIMIVPLLLTIGTHPAVASSTSSAMVLITSLVSTSTYAVFGLILWDYAVFGFFVAFFSSLVGQIIMGRLRRAQSASGRTFERNSYIAFVIGGVVLISAVLMTIQYIFSIVEGPDDDYGGLCDGLTFNT